MIYPLARRYNEGCRIHGLSRLWRAEEKITVRIFSKLAALLKHERGKGLLGAYAILGEPIAESPMSTVYKAQSRDSGGRMVAVKVLKDSAARVAHRLSTQLGKQWEGERAIGLVHPNVVRTIECGCDSGSYFIVMEFVDGHNLASLIYGASPLLEGRRIDIIRQIVQGLAYIHGQGLIHRDICPRNVLLDAAGHARLIDFGVAVSLSDKLLNTGRRTGRPSYMAPELIRDNIFDARTDLYALGVTMYEICTGAKPLAGTNRYEKMRLHLYSSPTPPADVNKCVPMALSSMIVRCLAKDPEQRFQKAEDLLKELPDEPF